MLRSKLLVGAALALVALLAAVSSANASTITSVAPGGAITSASSGKLTFGEGSITIECEVTLRGNLSTGPIAATSGSTFGSITEVSIDKPSCSGAEVERVLSLPWRLTYTEALPSQAELPNTPSGFKFTIVNVAFNISTFFGIVNCLYAGPAGGILSVFRTRVAGRFTTPRTPLPLRADETVRLPFTAGGSDCPSSGAMRGTSSLSVAQTITIS